MEYTITPSRDGTFILLKIKGDITRQAMMQANLEAHALGKQLEIKRYLVNATEAKNTADALGIKCQEGKAGVIELANALILLMMIFMPSMTVIPMSATIAVFMSSMVAVNRHEYGKATTGYEQQNPNYH